MAEVLRPVGAIPHRWRKNQVCSVECADAVVPPHRMNVAQGISICGPVLVYTETAFVQGVQVSQGCNGVALEDLQGSSLFTRCCELVHEC